MKEKDFIKYYFENHYYQKNKYVYNEEWYIWGSIFLFLLYLIISSFSSSNSEKIVNTISKDPEAPKKIIRNLQEIKKIILNDFKNQKEVKDIFNLIDDIDDNLVRFNIEEEKKKLIKEVTDQMIFLIQKITILYADQSVEKKNNLFNEIKKILTYFGLVDLFLKLLEQENKKNNGIPKDNSDEVIKLKKEDFAEFTKDIPIPEEEDISKLKSDFNRSLGIEEDEEESEEELTIEPETDLNDEQFDDDDDENEDLSITSDETEDRKKEILANKSLDQIKKEILSRRDILEYFKNNQTKEIYSYMLDNIDLFEKDEIEELYVNLIIYEPEDFYETFYSADIFLNAQGKYADYLVNLPPVGDFDKLLQYLKKKDIEVKEFPKKFWIRIDVDSYRTGRISPIKVDQSLTGLNYYLLMFYQDDNKFAIALKKEQKNDYKLLLRDFIFYINESKTDDYLEYEEICFGTWNFNSNKENKITLVAKSFSPGFEEIDIDTQQYKTFIGKREPNFIRELKNKNPQYDEQYEYYYCIKNDEDIYIKLIEGNFLSFLRSVDNKNYLHYNVHGMKIKLDLTKESTELKKLISIDAYRSKIQNFLNEASKNKKNLKDDNFIKVKKFTIASNAIRIDTTIPNWNNLG